MYIFNGINSKNYDKIALILNDKHTVIVDELPKVESTIIQEVDDLLYKLRKDDYAGALDILNKHNLNCSASSLMSIRRIIKVIKSRGEHIGAFGYLFKGTSNKNVVVTFRDEVNDRALLLMAILYGLLVRSSCVISYLDLSKLDIKDIFLDSYEEYAHEYKYVRMFENYSHNAGNGSTAKDSRENKVRLDTRTTVKTIERTTAIDREKQTVKDEKKQMVSKDIGLLGRLKFEHIPILEKFRLEEISLQGAYCKVKNNDTVYCKINVDNDYDTLELNKELFSFINTVTNGKINNVIVARTVLSATVNTNESKYKVLANSAYSLIEYWRNSNIKKLTTPECRRYMCMLAKDYSKLITNIMFRTPFINAFMQLYDNGSIVMISGLVWHNIILSTIYRLNSVPDRIAGYYAVALAPGKVDEKIAVDVDLYLTTLAMYALKDKRFNGVIIMSNVAYLPLSEADIEEKVYLKRIESREKVNTIAKEASNEISETLFNGESLGLYRDNQFNKNFSIVMSTIFEEIEQLWQMHSVARPGFKVENEVVTIPTIFADVKGVGDKSESEYIKLINRLNDIKHCKLYVNKHIKKEDRSYGTFEFGGSNSLESTSMVYNNACYNGVINRERLDLLCKERYPLLNMDKRNLIINKTEEACKLGLKVLHGISSAEIVQEIMTLPNKIIDDIIWFDFTKRSPKVIMLFTGRDILDKSDCITLYFLNLLGFDVVVFNPTAYAGLDGYLDNSTFESYDLGEPNFHVNYKKTEEKKKGLFSMLFG